MGQSINWANTPRVWAAALSTANTATDGSGTLVTVVSAVTADTSIYVLDAIGTATTAACLIYWVRVSGASRWVVEVMSMEAATVSTTSRPSRQTIIRPDNNPVFLPTGDSLSAYVTINANFHVRAGGGQH